MLRFTLKNKTMDKLISMREFVLKNAFTNEIVKDFKDVLIKHSKYAEFLSQQLSLEQFVPCKLVDGVWVVLEKPKSKGNITSFKSDRFNYNEYWEKQNKEYQKAKERCLFDGFEYNFKKEWFTNDSMILDEEFINKKTIEDLVKYNLTLTPTAKQQIGL